MAAETTSQWPDICTVGIDGLLVRFGDRLTEPANRAALAFRHAMERETLSGVEETSTSLVSAYVRFDPLAVDPDGLMTKLRRLIVSRDWFQEALPAGRHLWRIPTIFGTDLAPQLAEAADLAGLTPEAAIAQISTTQVRVQTIGFAPGQPYLGELPPAWDIPRQTNLTERIPIGALTVAIRQMTLFSVTTPTGWRHIGQTAMQLFRPDSDTPFPLRPGDEVHFDPIGRDAYERLRASGPNGGAVREPLP